MPVRICFVCLGNICRSPTAEAVFLHLIAREGIAGEFVVDSAGTGAWHAGERAHADTRAAATKRGIEVPSISRQFVGEDFERFDYVIAMDEDNRVNLRRLADEHDAKVDIHLFRDFDPASEEGAEVPDPYYAGGFDAVYDICDAAARGLLDRLRREHAIS